MCICLYREKTILLLLYLFCGRYEKLVASNICVTYNCSVSLYAFSGKIPKILIFVKIDNLPAGQVLLH